MHAALVPSVARMVRTARSSYAIFTTRYWTYSVKLEATVADKAVLSAELGPAFAVKFQSDQSVETAYPVAPTKLSKPRRVEP